MSQPEVELEGCGSHSCVIKKPVGQGTNSGCLCNASTLRLHIQKLNRRPAPIDGGGLDEKEVARVIHEFQNIRLLPVERFGNIMVSVLAKEICSTFSNRGLVAIDVNKINHAIWQVDEAMPLDLRMKIAEHIYSNFGTPPTKVEWPEKNPYSCGSRKELEMNAERSAYSEGWNEAIDACKGAHEKSLGKGLG